MVAGVRTAWEARDAVGYDRKPSEQGNVVFRRSLYVVADIAAGETFTAGNLRSIRPGYGLAPKRLPKVLGRRARRDLKRGDPLEASMVEGLGE
jgi:N-acetylneuraminate synthase